MLKKAFPVKRQPGPYGILKTKEVHVYARMGTNPVDFRLFGRTSGGRHPDRGPCQNGSPIAFLLPAAFQAAGKDARLQNM